MKPTEEKTGYHGNRVEVIEQKFEGSDTTWEIVKVKNAAAILGITKDGNAIFVKQSRVPINKKTLEIPAGVIETSDESSAKTAVREFMEETGYIIDENKLMHIFTYCPSSGYCTEKVDIYLATDLAIKGNQKLDKDEKGMVVIEIPIEKAIEMVINNEFEDTSATNIALMLYKLKYLERNE